MNKTGLKIISTFFPGYAASLAYRKLNNPQIKKIRPHELAVLDKADKETIKFKGFDIQCYTWKRGDNKVLLIHGWEGQAGNFADLIEKLLENNYTVYAFDAPAHGFSSKGKTSLYQFTELVGLLIKKYSVKKLVSHSFGGAATTAALFIDKDLKIDRYVLFTVPDKYTERINEIAAQTGISSRVKKKLLKRLEKDIKFNLNDWNVSYFVKHINVENALIIHDTNDAVIPIEQAKNVHLNWTNSEFLEITKTGHLRILRRETVIDAALHFLDNKRNV